jgi:DUF4097 and DUF4098 domain-containing protein YvlB
MSYTVDVRIDAGSVEIVAEEGDFTPVATVEPWDDSNASHEAAAATQVELRGDTLHVQGPKGRRLLGRSPRLRVGIRTPVDSTVNANLASADLTCRGRVGDVRATTASGDVYLEDAAGDVRVKTASGNLEASRIDGDVRFDTASGRITTGQVTGGVVVKGVSGEVEIGSAGSGIRVDNVSGDVRLGPLGPGDVTVKTVSGSVAVEVIVDTGIWLDLQTVTGNARSDLDDVVQQAPAEPDLTLRVRAVSGDIEVWRAPRPATRTAS